MGRGLSELQKTILRTALANRRAEALGPLRYYVEFDNQAELYDYDSPKGKDWRGIYEALGITQRGDHLHVWATRSRVGLAFAMSPSADPEHFAPLVDRLNAKGVKAWLAVEGDMKFGDVYLWEILDTVYGFGECRKIQISGRPEANHYPSWAVTNAGRTAEITPDLSRANAPPPAILRQVGDRRKAIRGGPRDSLQGVRTPGGARPCRAVPLGEVAGVEAHFEGR